MGRGQVFRGIAAGIAHDHRKVRPQAPSKGLQQLAVKYRFTDTVGHSSELSENRGDILLALFAVELRQNIYPDADCGLGQRLRYRPQRVYRRTEEASHRTERSGFLRAPLLNMNVRLGQKAVASATPVTPPQPGRPRLSHHGGSRETGAPRRRSRPPRDTASTSCPHRPGFETSRWSRR